MEKQEKKVIRLARQNNRADGVGVVKATYCLWFAWAPGGLIGPEGETTGSTYDPLAIDITNAVTVEITASPSDTWSHHPGNTSNAAGLGTSIGLENPAYRSTNYNSERIVPRTTNLNKLVAMQGFDEPPTAEVLQEEIGLSRVLNITNGHTRLFLGFHDGREWTNNNGEVNIAITITY